MSEQLNRSRGEKALMIAGAVAAIATGNALANPGQAEATPSLQKIEQLDGFDRKYNVGPKEFNKLKASTMLIMGQYEGTRYDSEPLGSATAISIQGQKPGTRLFLTSNRSIGVGPETGAFNLPNNPLGAASYSAKITGKKYTIVDPFASLEMRQTAPMGEVTRVSVNTKGNDVALGEVVSNRNQQTGEQLSAVSSIAYTGMKKVKPGQQMAIYSMPKTSKVPVKKVGRFLGTSRFQNEETDTTQIIHWVGYKAKSLNDDPGVGADGSIALAKNGTTGPSTIHVNIGYPSGESLASPEATAEAKLLHRSIGRDLEVDNSGLNSMVGFVNLNSKIMLKGLDNSVEKYGVPRS